MTKKRKGIGRERMKKMMDKYGPSKRRQMTAQDGEEDVTKLPPPPPPPPVDPGILGSGLAAGAGGALGEDARRRREIAAGLSTGTSKVKKKNTSKMGLRGC